MSNRKSNNLGAVALSKARELQDLIDLLNNTSIANINTSLSTLGDTMSANTDAIISVNAKIDKIQRRTKNNFYLNL